MNKYQSLSNKFVFKLGLSFLLIILMIGIIYISITFLLLDRFHSQTTQRLNANVANHLIEEKFKNESPFLEDGSVNIELFDDVMHDMMAVNRAIEVYLLDEKGFVLHSVVLKKSLDQFKLIRKVDLNPIANFIKNKEQYILGDDPKDLGAKKIFSAAQFKSNGKVGYIYVVLASHDFERICSDLFKGYFSKLTIITILITSFLSIGIGWLCILYISKSLLIVIHHVNKFKEGNLQSRIPEESTLSLSVLATTFNEMADTISDNIEEIKSINSFKKQLIANISHDLRSPLTLIRGYAETLNESEIILTEKNKQEFLRIIEKSTLTLANLVNQLNEYSKLDAKQLSPKKSIFDIKELITEIINRYHIVTNQKKVRVSLKHKSNQDYFVHADKILINRVIQNILDNALKFTPKKGTIIFYLNTEYSRVVVKIKDSGAGLNAEERDLIFDRWYTSKESHKQSGLGLGLAIAKKIIELHGTSILIHSEGINKGCEFSFSLPDAKELIN